MKILFLDIDGVLNSSEYFRRVKLDREPYPDGHLELEKIERINLLCQLTGYKIVLSSTWREFGKEVCNEILKRNGLTIDLHDITPDLTEKKGKIWTAKTRGDEIQAWIDEHKPDEYLIIDDDSDIHQKDRFIQTDSEYGFTDDKFKEALKIHETSNRL